MMKGLEAILFVFLFAGTLHAQVSYYKTSFGLKYGYTRYYGDLDSRVTLKPAVIAVFGYRLRPRIDLSAEVHAGRIGGGDTLNDPDQRFFRSSYLALFVNASLHLPVPGLSAGLGAGRLMSRITEIKRVRTYDAGKIYIFPGRDRSSDRVLQLLIEEDYPIKNRWKMERYAIGACYQLIFTNGDGLDGYDDPPLRFANKNKDLFAVLTLGLRIFLAPVGVR